MAAKGEIAGIYSQKQYDYFLKQCQSSQAKVTKDGRTVPKNAPLDARGQSRNAKRDEEGRVVEPGGGKTDEPPSQNQACQALQAFHRSGGKRSNLPRISPTKNAARKDLEHPKMRRDQVVRGAVRPRGSREYERRMRRNMMSSKEYLSKSINEDFDNKLDEALGL